MNIRSSIKTAVYHALSTPGSSQPTVTPASATFNTKAQPSTPTAQSSPICICDSLNYIRGFRYELFCIARQFLTTYCLVYCTLPMVEAYIWNGSEEREVTGYTPELFIDLFSRFEPPAAENHWERPFFAIQTGPSELYEENLILGSDKLNDNQKTIKEKKQASTGSASTSTPDKKETELIEEEEEEEEEDPGLIDETDEIDDEEWKRSLKAIEHIETARAELVEKKKKELGAKLAAPFGVLNDEEEDETNGEHLYATTTDEEIEAHLQEGLLHPFHRSHTCSSFFHVVVPCDLIEEVLFTVTGLTPPKSTLKA